MAGVDATLLDDLTRRGLVNQATGLSLTKGKIFIQTEGAEMYVRNIVLTPLK